MNLPATLTRAGPWLVALAPAWFIYDSLTSQLNVPLPVAIPIAAGVELTGVAAVDTWLALLAWNRKKRKIDPNAPARLALLPIGVYLIAGISLTAVLKQDPILALFFILAAAGYGTIAIQADQNRREAEVRQTKSEAQKERRQRRAERPPERPADNERPPQPLEHSPEFDGLVQIITDGFEHSEMSSFGQADVQTWIGRKRTTAYQVLNYGQEAGIIEQIGRNKYVCLNGKETDDA